MTLTDAFKTVNAAATAADLFNGDKDNAQRKYRSLAKVLHPDHVPAAKQAEANAAMAKLSALWNAYERGDADRTYASATIVTRNRTYVIGDLVAQGDLAGLYRGEFNDGVTHSVVLKITRSAANNDLTGMEAHALKRIAERVDEKGKPYFPTLLDWFRYRDEKGVDHWVNVFEPLDGWYTLAQVKTAYPDGLDIRDLLWMWKRLLIGIGHAHRVGVVHGAVIPEHVLIHGEEHGLRLVDWSYAAIEEPTDGGYTPFTAGWRDAEDEYEGGFAFPTIKAIVPHRRDMYPPEVLAKEPACAATDIFMSAKTVETLFNDETPRAFRAFIKGCTVARPEDAWALMDELTELSLEYFPRKFRPFSMPVGL